MNFITRAFFIAEIQRVLQPGRIYKSEIHSWLRFTKVKNTPGPGAEMEYIAGLAVEKWKTLLFLLRLRGSPPGPFFIDLKWCSDGYFIKEAAGELKNSPPSI